MFAKFDNDGCRHFGLLLLRVGIGTAFIIHGYPKLTGGVANWTWLGGQIGNLGITFAPTFWGFMAAFSECIGGAMLVLGLGTRLAAFLMMCTMSVATMSHLSKVPPDVFNTYSHPLKMTIVFLSLIFLGGGKWSLERIFCKKC